ncbi:MAG TPA: 1,2-phenylacetyl-CoA epoxidase subunit A, partial [Streptomyces sp.]|nr:1,2-phenylacetyl-CoA epoxidase subunit A [Streptomyces sp.]
MVAVTAGRTAQGVADATEAGGEREAAAFDAAVAADERIEPRDWMP